MLVDFFAAMPGERQFLFAFVCLLWSDLQFGTLGVTMFGCIYPFVFAGPRFGYLARLCQRPALVVVRVRVATIRTAMLPVYRDVRFCVSAIGCRLPQWAHYLWHVFVYPGACFCECIVACALRLVVWVESRAMVDMLCVCSSELCTVRTLYDTHAREQHLGNGGVHFGTSAPLDVGRRLGG